MRLWAAAGSSDFFREKVRFGARSLAVEVIQTTDGPGGNRIRAGPGIFCDNLEDENVS